MESRELRRMVSRKLNWIEIQLGCLQTMKNILFYRAFGRNRPIVSIDGYDGTVHHGPFQISRGHRIVMDGHDLIHR